MIQPVNTIKETSDILRQSHQTTYNEINAGRLETFKVGRRRYVSQEALLKYIKAREAEAS